MTRLAFALATLAAAAISAAVALPRGSQAAPAAVRQAPAATIQRTFVSTGGTDSNPCTRAEPCRSFEAAIAQTTAGGEVIALDSGGYGAFTVPKALTIAGAPGAHVAVTAFAGTGIQVAAGSDDTVILRNLYVTGLGADTGIGFQGGGSLYVDSVTVTAFTGAGLLADTGGTRVFVRDSAFRRNGGAGLSLIAELTAEISGTRSDGNMRGFLVSVGARATIVGSEATNNSSDGVIFGLGATAVLSDFLADGNGEAGAILASDARVTLSGVTLTNNATAGLYAFGGTTIARIGGSTVTGNETGLLQFQTGTLESFGDNLVRGNTTDTSGTVTTVVKT